jgi:hypothetical protein
VKRFFNTRFYNELENGPDITALVGTPVGRLVAAALWGGATKLLAGFVMKFVVVTS